MPDLLQDDVWLLMQAGFTLEVMDTSIQVGFGSLLFSLSLLTSVDAPPVTPLQEFL